MNWYGAQGKAYPCHLRHSRMARATSPANRTRRRSCREPTRHLQCKQRRPTRRVSFSRRRPPFAPGCDKVTTNSTSGARTASLGGPVKLRGSSSQTAQLAKTAPEWIRTSQLKGVISVGQHPARPAGRPSVPPLVGTAKPCRSIAAGCRAATGVAPVIHLIHRRA